MCDSCGCDTPPARVIEVGEGLLADNRRAAQHNREHFARSRVIAVNLMGTPGAGKTAMLEATISATRGRWRIAVIEGDQSTHRDADRIRAAGAPSVQVETGLGCHLDAAEVHHALDHLSLEDADFVFIENVGNLVCPALFDLGEQLRVVVTSTTEGTDKPLKYAPMFRAADIVVLNKSDLLPHVPFDLPQWRGYLRGINPNARACQTSATTGDGIAEWIAELESMRPSLVRPSETPA
jgi:hydrogenase nickel incorporation protein HypB